MAKKLKDLTEAELRQIIREETSNSLKAILNNEANQVGADDQEGFIDIAQASDFLKMAKGTIYKKTSNKTIPFHKIPGSKSVLFKKTELANWLREGRGNLEEL